MPAFLSPEWVDEFNTALAGADLGAASTGGSLVADDGHFRVCQLVTGVPGHSVPLALTLAVDGPLVGLSIDAGPAGGEAAGAAAADVVLTISYDDAVALARGELNVVSALSEGRVRVRGDLSVLVAGQAILAAASGQLGPLRAETTY